MILPFFSVTAPGNNWAVVSVMVLPDTLLNNRAFSALMKILIMNLLRDAASPTIICFIKDVLRVSLSDNNPIISTLDGVALLFSHIL